MFASWFPWYQTIETDITTLLIIIIAGTFYVHFVVIGLITIRVVEFTVGGTPRLVKQKEFRIFFSTRMTSLQVEEKYRIKGEWSLN